MLGLSLSILVTIVLTRSLPVLIQQHVYSCQTFIRSFTIEIFTCHLRTAVWLFGLFLAALILTRIGLVFYRIKKLKQQAIKLTDQYPQLSALLDKYDLSNQTTIIHSPEVFAFCFGIKQAHIYVSTTLIETLTTEELAAVLLHERHHARHHDSLTVFIASVTQMAFPFFPLLSDLIWRYRLTAELDADNAAITTLGSKTPLISVLKKLLTLPTTTSFAAAAIADTTLSSRITYLVNGQPLPSRLPWLRCGVSLASVAILMLIMLAPTTKIGLNTPAEAADICIGGATCTIRCTAVMQSVSPGGPAIETQIPMSVEQ